MNNDTPNHVEKMRILATFLILTTFSVTCPGAYAEDLSPAPVALDTPVVEQSHNNSLSASLPELEDSKTNSNIDIVNDSLKYHSMVNPQQNQMKSLTPQIPLNGSVHLRNNYMGNNSIQNRSPNQFNQMSANRQTMMPMNRQNQMYQMPMNRQMPQYGHQNQMQLSNKSMQKAIGVVGAAALMGMFVKNGGIGGLTRSMGWDNKRHIRGSSIGGY